MIYLWMPEANGDWHWSTGGDWQAAASIEQLSRDLYDQHQQEAVVFFPSADTQALSLTLPKAQYKKLGHEGVKYMLEEFVIVPVDQLQVLHHLHSPDQLHILAMGTQKLQTYQHALALLPFKITALLPDFLLVPHMTGKTVIAQIAGRCLIRESEFLGRQCEDLTLYLDLQQSETEYVVLNRQVAEQAQLSDAVSADYVCPVIKKPQQHPFNFLPKPKARNHPITAYAKACALVFAAILVVQLSYDALRWLQYKKIADMTAQQAIEQYQSWFGTNTPISEQNIRSQFEGQLRLSQVADTHALQLLSRIGPILMQQQIVAQSLKYETKQLDLVLKANSAEAIRNLSEQLKQQGLKVELGNIQATAQGAIGQVRIQS